MVVHDAGVALQVVIAEKAVPVGLALPQQGQPIPRGRQGQGEEHAGQGPQPPPEPRAVGAKQAKQAEGEGEQHEGHRSLAEHRQGQGAPTGPPGPPLRGVGAPGQQQAEGEGGGEKGIAHLAAPPHQHERPEGKGQGGAQGGGGAIGAGRGGGPVRGLGPAQEGLGQGQHRGEARQGGGKAGGPTAKRVKRAESGQSVQAAHEPVDQGWLVVAGQAVDPGDEPVAAFRHLARGSGEEGGGFIHQAGGAQAEQKHSRARESHQQQQRYATRRGGKGCRRPDMQQPRRDGSGMGKRAGHQRQTSVDATSRRAPARRWCGGRQRQVAARPVGLKPR